MELQEVTKQQAIILHNLGFNWSTHNSFGVEEHRVGEGIIYKRVSLPYQELVCKWLRDVHNIYIVVHIHSQGYSYNIHTIKNNREDKFLYSTILESMSNNKYIDSHDKAAKLAIDWALNYIKDGITTSK